MKTFHDQSAKKNKKAQKKSQITEGRLFTRRVIVVIMGIITGIATLIARAYYLQIVRNSYYRTRSDKNRVKIQVLPPVRGNIFDRNGIPLSENILSYDLVVNRAKSEKTDELVLRVANYMPISEEDLERYEDEKRKKRNNQDVIIRSDLTQDEINHFVVDLHDFPGFEVVPSYKRYYPHGDLTAHIVGYINNINKKDVETLKPREYDATTKIGRTGVERKYEKELHGKAGYRQAEVSRTGKTVRILEQIDAIPGEDLYLSLDLDFQRAINKILESGKFDGASVALDPNTGEVLAMHSNPSFDANLFVNGISHKDYERLRKSPRKNLFNRALNGKYSPASTIKPMMALAALHEYIVTADMRIECKGSYKIPNYEFTKRFFCWKRNGGHGKMNAKKSITKSCDVYYYNVGRELGIAKIHAYLSQFGLGHRTGIDLPNESAGLLPSKAWKEKKYKKPWFIGDTINCSIGQGYMLTTPLQLAYFMAILGARGKRYHPHFVTHYHSPETGKKEPKNWPKLEDVKQNNPKAWKLIHHALVEVMGPNGTAKKVKVDLPFKIAGKTGTAQVFSFKGSKRIKKDDLKKELRDNSVFVAYAPAEKPVIALAVILENAGGGSEVAAPVAVEMLEAYFALKKKRQIKKNTPKAPIDEKNIVIDKTPAVASHSSEIKTAKA